MTEGGTGKALGWNIKENRFDPAMTNDEYMTVSGAKIARQDITDGRCGYHRDLTNSPAYRDAYDTVMACHESSGTGCGRPKADEGATS